MNTKFVAFFISLLLSQNWAFGHGSDEVENKCGDGKVTACTSYLEGLVKQTQLSDSHMQSLGQQATTSAGDRAEAMAKSGQASGLGGSADTAGVAAKSQVFSAAVGIGNGAQLKRAVEIAQNTQKEKCVSGNSNPTNCNSLREAINLAKARINQEGTATAGETGSASDLARIQNKDTTAAGEMGSSDRAPAQLAWET